MDIIKVNYLTKIYNNVIVLNIPELIIETGESFGLVGNNGAGKTTFFRALLDLIKIDSGEILSNNANVANSEAWKQYTASYLDESFLIDFLSPEEYIEFIAGINRMTEGDVNGFLNNYSDFFNDELFGKNKLIRDLSKGNQKKLGIASALMTNPEILILDEPFANLDPSTVIRLKKILNQLKRDKNITILISSHDLTHVTEVCERILVLEKGKIIHDIRTGDTTLKELEEYFSA